MSNKFILKASAGTGKTYRLSLEYIAAILSNTSFENILVMTFTKMATAEIKERILHFFKILAYSGNDSDILKNQNELLNNLQNLYPSIDLSKENITASYKILSENSDNLKIYTIDGFTNKIFKSVIAPYIGISSYEIIDEDESEKIYFQLLESIFGNKKQFSIFKNFLDTNTERDVEKYKDVMKNLIESRWKTIILQESDSLRKKEKIKNPYNYLQILEDIRSSIVDIVQSKNTSEDFSNFLNKDFKFLENENSALWDNYIKKFKPALAGTKPWNGTKIRKSKSLDLEPLQEEVEKFWKSIAINVYNNEIISFENDILDLIKDIYANYDKIKIKSGKLTYSDISNYTLKHIKDSNINLFDENGVTEYFYDVFGGEIKTIFIDEFQDTSVLQWTLLKGIIDKCTNVICVGDEKQSIYSWRGGEKKLFENLAGIINAEEKSLDTCYRSPKKIIDFFNDLFTERSKLYLDEDTEMNTTWNFSPILASKERAAHISYKVVEKGEEDNLAYKEIIDILKKDFSNNYENIAILGRSNKQLSIMASYLSENKIPYTLESSDNIFSHRAVKDIFLLLEFLVNESFIKLCEFLRSDLIFLSNSDLNTIIHGFRNLERDEENSKFDINKDVIRNLYSVYHSLKEKNSSSKECLEVLEKIISIYQLYLKLNSENIHFSALISEISKSFNVLIKFSSSSDIVNYYRLIELSKDFLTLEELVTKAVRNSTRGDFKQISVAEKSGITLMTTHKSKGLEYDTVFYLHSSTRGFMGNEVKFILDLDENFEKAKNFLIFNSAYKKYLNYLKEYDFLKLDDLKEVQEKINVLYVGLTRAAKNLFIILDNPTKEDPLLLALSRVKINSDTLELNVKSESVEKTSPELLLNFASKGWNREKFSENIENLKEEIEKTKLEKVNSRLLGTAVHYFLENILYGRKEEIESSKKLTLSKFASELGENYLKKILDSSEISSFFENNSHIFSNTWDNIHIEFTIPSYIGDNLLINRIDRLCIKKPTPGKKGEILILDYKTGSREEEQLQNYEKAIKRFLKNTSSENDYNVKSEFITVTLPNITI